MELIRRYAEDLNADALAAARHFAYPACIWSERTWQGYGDASALGEFHAAYRRQLLLKGIAHERILMLRVEPLADAGAIVHAHIARESAAGGVLEERALAYTTVCTPAGWRIPVVLAG